MPDRFDVVVLGAGPTGEHAVGILLREGLKVALVEREFVGGECSGWACMPSKTLLRPTEVQGEAERVAGVSRPSLDWPKARIIQEGARLGVDFSLTHSCYDPDATGKPCGHCDACLLRKRAFGALGMRDPVLK